MASHAKLRGAEFSCDAGLPPAIILGVTTNGLSFVRSLGARGVPVWMLDEPRERPGMSTRFGTAVSMPDICSEPDAWLAKVLDLAERAPSPPVVIATGDEHVLFVSRHRDRLAPHVRFRVPPSDVVEMLCDKRRQYEWLIREGIAMPRTVFLDGGDDVVALTERTIGFPCVLKPSASHRWMRHRTGVKLAIAGDVCALRDAYDGMAPAGGPMVLQEFVPGEDATLHGYLAYCGRAGRPTAALTKRKLRQWPTAAGNGSLQISTRNEEIASTSETILMRLGYEGLVGIEYKWDARAGRYLLIEINPRSVSGNQLAIDCGIDFPLIACRDVLGTGEPPPVTYRCGIKYLHLGWDVQAAAALRRAGTLTIRDWLWSLRGVRSTAMFSPSDPKPFLAYVWLALRRRLRRGITVGMSI